MTYAEIIQKAKSKGFNYLCRDSDGYFCAFVSEPIADDAYTFWRLPDNTENKKLKGMGFASDSCPAIEWKLSKIDLRKV